jgi:hypothetical protein
MRPQGAHHLIRTQLVLGVQLDDFDYRLFLREYHKDLRSRFPSDDFPAYAPNDVLDSLMSLEPNDMCGKAGGRFEALRQFALRSSRLDFAMTASDFGRFEQRHSPYRFDRAFYHLGRVICSARLKMEYTGYNPFKATRQWNIDFVREYLDDIFEVMPDYLWWAMHDQRDSIANALMPEQLDEARRRIESAGYKVNSLGLYLTTLETMHAPDEELPA